MKYLVKFIESFYSFVINQFSKIVLILCIIIVITKRDYYLWKYIYLVLFFFLLIDKTHVLINEIKNKKGDYFYTKEFLKILFHFILSLGILMFIIYRWFL